MLVSSNFGELLQHPVYEALRASSPWLADLLEAFDAGRIERYRAIVSENAASLGSAEILVREQRALAQKIAILALVDLCVKVGAGTSIEFARIVEHAHLPDASAVEHLVMRALSLGLIRGRIDGVASRLDVEWVQPRVLDREQVRALADRLGKWVTRVDDVVAVLRSDVEAIAV